MGGKVGNAGGWFGNHPRERREREKREWLCQRDTPKERHFDNFPSNPLDVLLE